MYTVIGTCSICGGDVTVPQVWGGVIPPVPTCNSCGATKRRAGPVIDMAPATPNPWIRRTDGIPQTPSTHPYVPFKV